MELSDEQNRIVIHGLGREKWWEPIEMPTGRLELPDWLRDCYVDMCRGYANSPRIMFRTKRDPWPLNEEARYTREDGGYWRARSSDGLVMQQHAHSGPISRILAWRVTGLELNDYAKSGSTTWTITDAKHGQSHADATREAAERHLASCRELGSTNAVIEYKECWATTKDSGYGGHVFWVKRTDGSDLALRGPWHSTSPVGWYDLTVLSDEYDRKYHRDKPGSKYWRPWYKRGGVFGWYFCEQLLINSIATYQPHLRLARVYDGYGWARVQPYEIEWGCPKDFLPNGLRAPGEGTR